MYIGTYENWNGKVGCDARRFERHTVRILIVVLLMVDHRQKNEGVPTSIYVGASGGLAGSEMTFSTYQYLSLSALTCALTRTHNDLFNGTSASISKPVYGTGSMEMKSEEIFYLRRREPRVSAMTDFVHRRSFSTKQKRNETQDSVPSIQTITTNHHGAPTNSRRNH